MNNDENTVQFSVGKKVPVFKFQPFGFGNDVQTQVIAMSPFVFSIAIKVNWDRREIRNFDNQFTFTVSQINDVIDFVGEIENCISFDVAFNPGNKPFEKFNKFDDGEGMAFQILFVNEDDVLIHQRLISLNNDKSNTLVKVLNEVSDLGIVGDEYNRRITNLYNSMTTREIQKENFIRQVFRKTRKY